MLEPTRRSHIAAGVLTALVAAAPAANVAAQGEPSNVAQTCIRPSSIDRTTILDDRNVLFFMRDDDVVFHNVLPSTCPSLRVEERFAYDVAGDRLCVGSSITVLVEQGLGQFFPGAVCRLGMFLPVTEDEVSDLFASSRSGKRDRKNRRGPIEAKPVELPPSATEPASAEPTPAEPAPAESAPNESAPTEAPL